MSLHAQLSPEAQARLAAQRRTSTITSLIIAILVMVLLGVILLIIALASNVKEIPQIISYVGTPDTEETITKKKVQTNVQRKPSAPSSSMAKVIASNTTSPTAIPVPDFEVPTVSTDFGDGDGFGDGWGSGNDSGSGSGFSNIPASMKKRCSRADRIQRLLSNGGTEACEESVVNALRFLKKTQNPNGSWEKRNNVAMTGLALLAYLGHCETAQSPEFGETVLGAVNYLSNVALKNNGKLSSDFKDKHWPYENAIALYALAEAYTLCVKGFNENFPGLEEAVQLAGQFMINSQHRSGAWEYAYDTDNSRGGDTSIAGWHIQALKACEYTGIEYKNLKRASKKAIDYMESMQNQSGAIGYSSPKGAENRNGNGVTLTAVGALCFQIWEGSSDANARKATRFIDKNVEFKWNSKQSELYGHYYAVQAMINQGGEPWERYNALFRDQVLKNQAKDGSFKNVGGGKPVEGSGVQFQGNNSFQTHYRTCLATLMLEAYYRFLPATGQDR